MVRFQSFQGYRFSISRLPFWVQFWGTIGNEWSHSHTFKPHSIKRSFEPILDSIGLICLVRVKCEPLRFFSATHLLFCFQDWFFRFFSLSLQEKFSWAFSIFLFFEPFICFDPFFFVLFFFCIVFDSCAALCYSMHLDIPVLFPTIGEKKDLACFEILNLMKNKKVTSEIFLYKMNCLTFYQWLSNEIWKL